MGCSGSKSDALDREIRFKAIQSYELRSDGYHREISFEKRMPVPPPPMAVSPMESWSSEELCDFIRQRLTDVYGDTFLHVDTVVSNFQAELLDGGRLKHLQPQDWKRICPFIGPRTVLVDALKNYKEKPEEPKSPPPKRYNPASWTVPKETGEAATTQQKTTVATNTLDSPNTPNEESTLPTGIRVPGKNVLSWREMLTKRSKFSNHRMIDCPWFPDPTASVPMQIWQVFNYELMRIVFLAMMIRYFGIHFRQIAFLVIPIMSTWICYQLNFFVDHKPSLFTTMIVFPLAFALNAAYQRREQALQFLALVKAAASALHCFSVCWSTTQTELPSRFVHDVDKTLRETFRNYGLYLTSFNEQDQDMILENIYQQHRDIFHQIDMYRLTGIGPALVTVPFNNAIHMVSSFERLRQFCDYRTPCTIRCFATSSVTVLAICMGPWFANLCHSSTLGVGYLNCVVFFWLFMAVGNIQTMLENPYVTHGRGNAEDDINLRPLMGVAALSQHRREMEQMTVDESYVGTII